MIVDEKIAKHISEVGGRKVYLCVLQAASPNLSLILENTATETSRSFLVYKRALGDPATCNSNNILGPSISSSVIVLDSAHQDSQVQFR
jgi:hypothetical protein